MSTVPSPILISSRLPAGLRLCFAGGALGLMVVMGKELLPGVWPPNLLTPFFGLIVAGGFAVLAALMSATLLGPDVTWRIEAGRIEIERTLFGRRDRVTLDAAHVEARLLRNEDTDGPATWHLVLEPQDSMAKSAFRALHQSLWLPVFLQRSPASAPIWSPAFANQSAAEEALSLLEGSPSA